MSQPSRRRPRAAAFRAAAIAMGALSVLATAQIASAGTPIVSEMFGAGWTPGSDWAVSNTGTFVPQIATVVGQVPESALRLTEAATASSGVVSYTTPQPTVGGLDVRFTMSQWSGGTAGDGISFFLRKGSNPSNAPGGAGGDLGYVGMPGGLLGVGFDAYGVFPLTTTSGSGCDPGAGTNQANSISIRGPGEPSPTTTGYCLLGTSGSQWVTASPMFNVGSTRAGSARAVRITVDPSTQANPQVKVYYDGNATAALSRDVPAEVLAEPTFKFGFGAATGGATQNNDIWDVQVSSLVDLPPVDITTASLPAGTNGTAYPGTTIATSNGVAPVTFTVTSGALPAGLSLSASTGEITGTPTGSGSSAFTVTATDSRTPTPSTDSRAYSVTIAAVAPGAPTIGSASAPLAQATDVSFTAPVNTGGASITAYTATCVSSDGGATRTGTGAASPVAVAELTRGKTYTCSVTATNSAGTSPASGATAAFAVPSVGAPGAPSGVVAVPGDRTAVVTWDPPADDGGSPITSYTVTAAPGGQTCTWTSGPLQCTLTGLTDGTTYTFTVRATNAVGSGPASSASSGVVPVAGGSSEGGSTPAEIATSAVSARLLPSRSRLVSGQAMRIGIRTTNSGTAPATSVIACIRLPSNLAIVRRGSALRSGRTLCFRQGTIAAGAGATGIITVRAVSARRVSRVITGTVRAAGQSRVSTLPVTVVIRPRSARTPVTG